MEHKWRQYEDKGQSKFIKKLFVHSMPYKIYEIFFVAKQSSQMT